MRIMELERNPSHFEPCFSLQHFLCFLDDAEVQRQKMVPVLISDGRKPSIGSLGLTVTPTHPSVCSSIPPSLLHWDTWDFLPQHNVEYCSYLSFRVELRGRQGRRTTSEGANKWCPFLCSCLLCLSLFSLSSEVADWPLHLEILHSHLPKCPLLLSPLRVHRGPVFKPRNTAEKKKRQIPNEKKNT